MKNLLVLVVLLFGAGAYAQTIVKGNVSDTSGQPVPGANVVIVGKAVGTVTDFDGNFTLETSELPPFKLRFSSIGYSEAEMDVITNNQELSVVLNEEQTMLDEIVISASRTPERIFESPVTVERFGTKEIKNTPSADFYSGLESLKGVDVNTNSLTFKSINTRGFASFTNTRFMQLVDGMDNSTPALNYPIGNLVGLMETDVLSVELLPGAASALYGANAFNGILFMRSKNPFEHPGISGYIKQGITSQDAAGTNPYTDVGIRMAHKFSDYFAAKVNFGWIHGTDWFADNYDGKPGTGADRSSLNYDGFNVYGDEVSTNLRAASGGLGIIPNVVVSRTGYNEEDLTDYKAENVKADWGLYFRPWANDFEVSYVGKIGRGASITQGTSRYRLNNFKQQQHKLEVGNDNFFLRGYVVSDNAGNSYDMTFTGININRAWKSDTQWFGEYINTFAAATLAGATESQAHQAARAQAESGRYEPGTPEFESALNRVINDPDLNNGSKFQDQSKYYHVNGNYNLSHLIDFAEIQVGGSYRKYKLNSLGTIYTDYDGPITYSEFGAYTQIQKQMDLSDNLELKLTGSLRYDKSELFDGFLSPRLTAGITVDRNHNFRASYQTGFRNPTTQDLFIGLNLGSATLIGSADSNLDRDVRTYNVSPAGQMMGQPATVNIVGRQAYEDSFSASSVQMGAPTASDMDPIKPEQVSAFEVGYRGKLDWLNVDLSLYYNSYKDFISNETVIVPFYGQVGDNSLSLAALQNGDMAVYRGYTNSDANVNSYGASIALAAKVIDDFDLEANYTYAKLDFDSDAYPDFQTSFNTPEHKVKLGFGNAEVFKNFGFKLSWLWSDTYYWESTFGNGQIPSYHSLDGQLSYRIPKIKSVIKVGATNMLGKEYFTNIGGAHIGSMYYASIVINNF